jgi:hypothetical protein
MVFATSNDLVSLYDFNIIGQLVTDTKDPVPLSGFSTNTYITAAIARASGDIRMACQKGQMYSDDDLASVYGSLDTSLRMQLVSLCVDRTMGYLFVRRSQLAKDWEQLASRAAQTDQLLEALSKGFRLFTLAPQEAAGVTVAVTQVATSPLNSMAKALFPRFFPPGLTANNSVSGYNPY